MSSLNDPGTNLDASINYNSEHYDHGILGRAR